MIAQLGDETLSIAESAARGAPVSDSCVKLLGETCVELAVHVDTLERRLKTVRAVATNIEKATADGDLRRTERALETLRQAGLL